jgi:hypothetical protein
MQIYLCARRPPQQFPAQVKRGAAEAIVELPLPEPAAKDEIWRSVRLEPHLLHSTESRLLAITSFSKAAPHSLHTYS